jgi:hypothetical protein
MPNLGSLNTAGVTTSTSTISNAAISSGITNTQKSLNTKYRYRVTGLLPNGDVYYEDTFNNYTKSNLGNPNLNNIASPLNLLNFQQPLVGEYIDVIPAGDAKGSANNANNPSKKMYYTGPLNMWGNIATNKNLDPSVAGQTNESKETNINTKSFTNSLNGFI